MTPAAAPPQNGMGTQAFGEMLAQLVAALAPPAPPPSPVPSAAIDGDFLAPPEEMATGAVATATATERLRVPGAPAVPVPIAAPVPEVAGLVPSELAEPQRLEVAEPESTERASDAEPAPGAVPRPAPPEARDLEYAMVPPIETDGADTDNSGAREPREAEREAPVIIRNHGSSLDGELRAALQGAAAIGATPRPASATTATHRPELEADAPTVRAVGLETRRPGRPASAVDIALPAQPFHGELVAPSLDHPAPAQPDARVAVVVQALRELLETPASALTPEIGATRAAMIATSSLRRVGVPNGPQSLAGAGAAKVATLTEGVEEGDIQRSIPLDASTADAPTAETPAALAGKSRLRPLPAEAEGAAEPLRRAALSRPIAPSAAPQAESADTDAATGDAPAAAAAEPATTAAQPTTVIPVAPPVTGPMTVNRTAPASERGMAAPPEPPALPSQPGSQVTVILDSEIAGATRIRVALRGDVVHATIVADVAAAVTLTQRLPELQRALRDRGFSDAQLSVRVLGAESVVAPGAIRTESSTAASNNADARNDSEPRQGQRRADPDGKQRQQSRHPEPEESA
ncbi:MAG: flagellar hook-length control protein FliK [Gemmatimonadota bacterium]|nr:flagellar hook-length control protein FliK [Gemmatimonadota bacterium]